MQTCEPLSKLVNRCVYGFDRTLMNFGALWFEAQETQLSSVVALHCSTVLPRVPEACVSIDLNLFSCVQLELNALPTRQYTNGCAWEALPSRAQQPTQPAVVKLKRHG